MFSNSFVTKIQKKWSKTLTFHLHLFGQKSGNGATSFATLAISGESRRFRGNFVKQSLPLDCGASQGLHGTPSWAALCGLPFPQLWLGKRGRHMIHTAN